MMSLSPETSSDGGRRRKALGLAASLIFLPLLLLAVAVYRNSIADPFDNLSSNHQKVADEIKDSSTATIDKEGIPTRSNQTIGHGSFSDPETGASSTNTSQSQSQSQPPPAAALSKTNFSSTTPIITTNVDNKLLDGLLAVGFNERSCLSRHQSHLYRKKKSIHKPPSQHLISKLRIYEELHRKCGPRTNLYRKATKTLLLGKSSSSLATECKYLVWIPANGLGNRMVSLVSAFLYALLTNRVLLVELGPDASGLFCEPFLNSTWILPTNFPRRRHFGTLPTHRNMIRQQLGFFRGRSSNKNAKQKILPSSILFVNLQHQSEEPETYFHCDQAQQLLHRVPALVLRSDQYFVPSLFMIPSFQEDLNLMFPEQEVVFHHLGRYLLHPTNLVWGRITRFYQAYLSGATQKIGLQIRAFAHKTTPTKTIMDQILKCTRDNNLLPDPTDHNINHNNDNTVTEKVTSSSSAAAAYSSLTNQTSGTKALLVASLYPEYFESLRSMYQSSPTTRGETVRVYQPSHEGKQKFNNRTHAVKALTEMYLLSMCDVLVTSGLSTFGYVAQGLSGLRPWIMYKTSGTKLPNPPCRRAFSMEPCFHYPPVYDCRTRTRVPHISSLFTNMNRCVDISTGVTLVAKHS